MLLKRIWNDGNIKEKDATFPIKQIYAWIFVESKNQIVIVSKNGKNWQMPGGKPEFGKNVFETLKREVHEETGIDINLTSNESTSLFGYYYINEDGSEYLQLRYFINIEDIEEGDLRPNEKSEIDSIKYVKLVKLAEIKKQIPWLSNSGELNGFINILNGYIMKEDKKSKLIKNEDVEEVIENLE